MVQEEIWRDFSALPPDAQRQVLDFIVFLRSRYEQKNGRKKHSQTALRDEPFIGMWKDRDDMQNSSDWVRTIRTHEWS